MRTFFEKCITVLCAVLVLAGFVLRANVTAFFSDYHKTNADLKSGSLSLAVNQVTLDASTIEDGGLNKVSFRLQNAGISTASFLIAVELAFSDEADESGRLFLYDGNWSDEDVYADAADAYDGALIGLDASDTEEVDTAAGVQLGIRSVVGSGILDGGETVSLSYWLLFVSGATTAQQLEQLHNRALYLNVVADADVSGRSTGWAVQATESLVLTTVVDTRVPVLTVVAAPKTFFVTQAESLDLYAYATAWDEEYGDISQRIEVLSSPQFESGKAGVYTLTYHVENESGKEAAPVSVQITVWDFVKVVSGNHHSLALTSHGRVYAWGRNVDGQLGDGTKLTRTVPTLIATPNDVIDIAACNSSSYALTADGQLYAWGHNGYGHLGNNTTDNSLVPIKVTQPDGVRFTSVYARYNTAGAITENGEVYTWGYGRSGATGLGESIDTNPLPQKLPLANIVSLTFGSSFGAAQTAEGKLVMWGSNLYGTLGANLAQNNAVYAPLSVPYFENSANALASISAGHLHMTALTQDGRLLTWGYGLDGRLGHGGVSGTQATPLNIPLGFTPALTMGGYDNSAVVSTDGTVYGFGSNDLNKLGVAGGGDLPIPTRLSEIGNITHVSLLPDTTLITVGGSTVYGAGNGDYGVIGNDSVQDVTEFVAWAFSPPPPV